MGRLEIIKNVKARWERFRVLSEISRLLFMKYRVCNIYVNDIWLEGFMNKIDVLSMTNSPTKEHLVEYFSKKNS